MRRLAETFRQVDPGNGFLWKDRVLLGYWTVIISLHLARPAAYIQ